MSHNKRKLIDSPIDNMDSGDDPSKTSPNTNPNNSSKAKKKKQKLDKPNGRQFKLLFF